MYSQVFGVALLVNLVITFRASPLWNKYAPTTCISQNNNKNKDSLEEQQNNKDTSQANTKSRHAKLLRNYLLVYLLATLSDWLQGPYVYALYDAYGYTQHDIAVLFVAGFGSSMVFGSFIGGMADWGGRRRFVILFSIIYASSCMTKHFNNYWILMLGRLTGGVATSLLFSVFEAWLIRSHTDAKLDKSLLSTSFSTAAYGNSVIAIVAGLVANKAASSIDMVPLFLEPTTAAAAKKEAAIVWIGGYLVPFDIALVALIGCGVLASTLWEENYGETSASTIPNMGNNKNATTSASLDDNYFDQNNDSDDGRSSPAWYDGLKNAFNITMRNRDVLLCGIISSLFEGSMYVFVFMWTPALTNLTANDNKEGEALLLPFGLIFSTFMVCCMAGSSLFSILIQQCNMSGEALAVGVFCVASLSMAVVACASDTTTAFCAMNLFEMCVGMYFPIMGTMKGSIVPESKRAAIYNLYRIPLNFIVLFSLLTDLTPTLSFVLNSLMLGTATTLQIILMKRRVNMTNAVLSMPLKDVDEEETVSLAKATVADGEGKV